MAPFCCPLFRLCPSSVAPHFPLGTGFFLENSDYWGTGDFMSPVKIFTQKILQSDMAIYLLTHSLL